MKDIAYFISDIHLGSAEEPKSFLFNQFLDCVIEEKPSHLFLMGDIFDLWIADYSYFINKYSGVIERLKKIKSLGTEIHYFEGNHDLYLEHYFGRQLGFQVHEGPADFQLWGKSLRLEHGDQMDPDDKNYIYLRWFLRTGFMKLAVRLMPEIFFTNVGEKASVKSRQHNTSYRTDSNEQIIIGKIKTHVEKLLREKKYDYFLAGHVHVIMDQMIQNCRVFNSGTWLNKPCFLRWEKDKDWQWIYPEFK